LVNVWFPFSAAERDIERLCYFKGQNSNVNKKFLAKTMFKAAHGNPVADYERTSTGFGVNGTDHTEKY
jgi:hypothetical protein